MLQRLGWAKPVALFKTYTAEMREVRTESGKFVKAIIHRLEDVRLTQTSALFLLQGASLQMLFDTTLLPPTVMPASSHKVRPFLLVRSEFPDLVSPVPQIGHVHLAMLMQVDPDVPIEEVRQALFLACW